MYVYALYSIFQCEFSCNSYYVIRLVTSLFYMYVYVLYSIFQCEFSYNCHYVIQRLYFHNMNVVIIRQHFSIAVSIL